MDIHNDVIETTLLRGKVKLLQPQKGFHASLDTVFLAAAVSIREKQKLLDVGCGVGSSGLCVMARTPEIHLTGIDLQQELVDLACQNAVLNRWQENCRFFCGDIADEKFVPDNAFHQVMMNPPYMEDGAHTPSPQRIKALANGGASLEVWVKYANRKLKNGGFLTLIHRADRLDEIVRSLTARRWFGSLVIYPLYSYAGEDAKRVIIRARKERYAPTVLKSGLVIHEKGGKYTNGAEDILSAAGSIDLD